MSTLELTPPTKDLSDRRPRPHRLQLTDQAEHHHMPTFLEVIAELGYPQAPDVAEQVNRWNAAGQQGWFTDEQYRGGEGSN